MSHRVLLVLPLLLLSACGGKDPVGGGTPPPPPPPPAPPPILVDGFPLGSQFAVFQLSRGALSMADAVVILNGVQLTTKADGLYNSSGLLPQPLQPGEQLLLRVLHRGDEVTAMATTTVFPVLTSPVPQQAITPGQPLSVAWTSSASPEWWSVLLAWRFNGVSSVVFDSLGPSARSATLATATIPAGATNVRLILDAMYRGTFTGPIDPASTMRFEVPGGTVPLVVGP